MSVSVCRTDKGQWKVSACAYRQMEIAKEQFDENGLMKNGDGFWGFIDWTEGL